MQIETNELKERVSWGDFKIFPQLTKAIQNYPNLNWSDATSESQILSKLWLIDSLKACGQIRLGKTLILGGWVGLLGHFLLNDKNLEIEKIRSIDKEPNCEKAADLLNLNAVSEEWRFKAGCEDWDLLNYVLTEYRVHRWSDNGVVVLRDRFDTIINTCCEHMGQFNYWINEIPTDRLLILQSNSDSNFEGHVNPSPSLEHFLNQTQIKRVLFQGALKTPQYSRWLVIGYRG